MKTVKAVTRHTPLADVPEFLRVREVAALLGISRDSAYDLIQRGTLRSARLGKLLFVPKAALQELADGPRADRRYPIAVEREAR